MVKAFDREGHSVIVQAPRVFGVPEIMAVQHCTLVGFFLYVEVNGSASILITIKTGRGAGRPSPIILFS
jgi:hypothetical protein